MAFLVVKAMSSNHKHVQKPLASGVNFFSLALSASVVECQTSLQLFIATQNGHHKILSGRVVSIGGGILLESNVLQ